MLRHLMQYVSHELQQLVWKAMRRGQDRYGAPAPPTVDQVLDPQNFYKKPTIILG